jgi:hypothetical protein
VSARRALEENLESPPAGQFVELTVRTARWGQIALSAVTVILFARSRGSSLGTSAHDLRSRNKIAQG